MKGPVLDVMNTFIQKGQFSGQGPDFVRCAIIAEEGGWYLDTDLRIS